MNHFLIIRIISLKEEDLNLMLPHLEIYLYIISYIEPTHFS